MSNFISGKYKVQLWDKTNKEYFPPTFALGVHVEIKDPDEKTIMSRVRVGCMTLLLSHLLLSHHVGWISILLLNSLDQIGTFNR